LTEFDVFGGVPNDYDQLPRGDGFWAATGYLYVKPVNPTGAASEKMMGLGVDVNPSVITPTGSRLMFSITGNAGNSSSGQSALISMRYGTGTPPNNGDARAGTLTGRIVEAHNSAAAARFPFALLAPAVGLTPGVPVWVDIDLNTDGAGTASVYNLTVVAWEF
jgi:hypothetical protein